MVWPHVHCPDCDVSGQWIFIPWGDADRDPQRQVWLYVRRCPVCHGHLSDGYALPPEGVKASQVPKIRRPHSAT